MIKTTSRLSVTFGLMLFAALLSGQANEIDVAKQRLSMQVALIERIAPDLERLDQARLVILKKAVQKVQGAIDAHGLSNIHTMRAYQELIVKFRFSSAFFTEVSSPRTTDTIKKIISINEQIRAARGFDDTPYTKITESVYTHMHTLLRELMDGPDIPDSTEQKIEDLIAPIARLIATAKNGDRPDTFRAGIKFYRQVVELYPDFSEISSSHDAFNIVLEIQGLNEFYGEFAQITYQEGNDEDE